MRRVSTSAWLLAALAPLVALLQWMAFRHVLLDDAYISYRYAENLVLGRGFVFNPGEWRLGSTAPGHVLLAAALRAIVGHDALPAAMALAGCLGWTAQAGLLLPLLAPRLGDWTARVVATGVALGGATSGSFVSLETNLVAALVLASALAAERNRPALAGGLAGLAVLTRPDALAWAGLLALWGLRGLLSGSGRPGWRAALEPVAAFLAPLLPWTLFALHAFGSPLPASAAAKYHQTPLGDYAVHLLRVGPGRLAPGDAGPALLAIAGLAAYGATRWVRAGGAGPVLVAWAAGHGLCYLALRPLTLFLWHAYPIMLLVVTCAFAGAVGLATHPSLRPPVRRLARLAVALLLAVVVQRGHATVTRFESNYWGGQRTRVYLQVADWLRAHVPSSGRVALMEVGLIAWHSDVRVHDLAGLVTPRTQRMPPDVTHVVALTHFPRDFNPGRAPVAAYRDGRFGAWIFDLRSPAGR